MALTLHAPKELRAIRPEAHTWCTWCVLIIGTKSVRKPPAGAQDLGRNERDGTSSARAYCSSVRRGAAWHQRISLM